MSLINIAAVEQQARRLRAEDLRRRQPILAPRMGAYLYELGECLARLAVPAARAIQPFFSWNPMATAHRG